MEGIRPYLYRLSQIRRSMFRENEEEEEQEQPGMLPDDVPDDRCFTDQFFKPNERDNKSIYSSVKEREISSSSGKGAGFYKNIERQIPSTFNTTDAYFDSRVYNAQFSPDGDMLYCSSQREIRIYNTEDIHSWKLDRQIEGHNINWTITDIDLSPCQEFLLYTTLEPQINLISLSADVGSVSKHRHRCLNLSEQHEDLGIYSAKFSGDGKEIVAGTSNESIVLYDLIQEKEVYRVPRAHTNDINTVCFANRENSQVIFTGSDDSSIRIWDRRTLGSKSIPEGVLIGHREGITHISSKGDGYTLISNCKDQTIKLWDIRKMKNYNHYRNYARSHPYHTQYDYRWWRYPLENYTKRLSEDCSLLTFRGHSVLSTLIRCYFSPSLSTDQRYIVSGSADGRVFIYDTLTGKKVKVLNPEVADTDEGPGPYPIVRDVSWHPHLSAISATAFDGNINYYYI